MPALNPPSTAYSSSARRGAMAAFGAYFLWGTLPVYWKLLEGIPVVELMAHRIIWTLVVVLLFQTLRGRLSGLRETWRSPANRRAHARGGIMVTLNWSFFVWALLNDQVIEASLGYFLVPLVNAALGRIIFGESLDTTRKVALGFAALGVAALFTQIQNPPWVSLGIALTWCTYGVGRKQSDASAINGLALELTYMAPIALAYLAWLGFTGQNTFGAQPRNLDLIIIGTGLISMIPLVLFAYATRRLLFTTLGLLQYTAPTCQFLMGWLIYGESFTGIRIVGFSLIWIGLICYVFGTYRARPRN